MLVDDLGIIGFMPTRDPSWSPPDLRTAWTLGVENLLTAEEAAQLDSTGIPNISHAHSLGFWGTEAIWGKHDASATIRIPKHAIRSVRSSLRHGVITGTVEMIATDGNERITLTGKGEIDANAEHVHLGIDRVWTVSA